MEKQSFLFFFCCPQSISLQTKNYIFFLIFCLLFSLISFPFIFLQTKHSQYERAGMQRPINPVVWEIDLLWRNVGPLSNLDTFGDQHLCQRWPGYWTRLGSSRNLLVWCSMKETKSCWDHNLQKWQVVVDI